MFNCSRQRNSILLLSLLLRICSNMRVMYIWGCTIDCDNTRRQMVKRVVWALFCAWSIRTGCLAAAAASVSKMLDFRFEFCFIKLLFTGFDYLSRAVLVLIAMTHSSPQDFKTVH